MSRALDKEILASLKSEDPVFVYQDISSILVYPPSDNLLEIELLGKSHPLEPGINFLQDGNAVAIPKLRLTQAFFVACQIIRKHLSEPPKSPMDKTVEATAVVLLMDPEHLTAANLRKRAVQSRLAKGEPVQITLLRETRFVDSLLTARLHRHTKSPTLWSHRRWLMRRFHECGLHYDLRGFMGNVVMVAAERHPRNYYAWDHARYLVKESQLEAQLYRGLVDDVKEWCFKHHNDISGWMYLGFLVSSIGEEGERAAKCSSVLTDTIDLVRTFQWTNESVWVFLRTMTAREPASTETLESFDSVNRSLASAAGDDTATGKILDEARQWVASNPIDRKKV
ncbi:uncharacterized protein BCR38DRAFT_457879 [Pseudomassariella vexata]|uniref:Protein prenyltransferase n=1 Tax=Pseudomassariella vexata TaxID=1141098 RepID=A0A1Y2DYD4_9PEZI|nr:uncharacterized protein BCR38DRAFT_457879 [Pseudomassariella vexata]ORY64094.1 hypothetical protein BCR38DRAFT_457879 [Pseudomassariella vexata]